VSAERVRDWPCGIVNRQVLKPSGLDAAYMPRPETVALTCKCGWKIQTYADQAWAAARQHMEAGNRDAK